MAKFQKGQPVWGAILTHDGFTIGQAVVEACGESKVTLRTMEPCFRWRLRVSVDDVHETEMDALVNLSILASRDIESAEDALKLARKRKSDVVTAMAEASNRARAK